MTRVEPGEIFSEKINPKMDEIPDHVCYICKEPLVNTEPGHLREPVAMQCTDALEHIFHRECITKWMQAGLPCSNECPVCRVDPRQMILRKRVAESIGKQIETSRYSRWRPARWIREMKQTWIYAKNHVLTNKWFRVAMFINVLLILGFVYSFIVAWRLKNVSRNARLLTTRVYSQEHFVKEDIPEILDLLITTDGDKVEDKK